MKPERAKEESLAEDDPQPPIKWTGTQYPVNS